MLKKNPCLFGNRFGNIIVRFIVGFWFDVASQTYNRKIKVNVEKKNPCFFGNGNYG
jgi:hypothetical protein